ncbi:hypothetical protein Vadar_012815 [Vaccinium darrowii]|uniref:Uncharacterized protein n=1 Tax=Vaccinium darrowii TaxID=229202 RepID=A0ACB7ZJL0_9ERIC|nr:hypothetical protein Vadar_012815 [Vaccinium darrowii]
MEAQIFRYFFCVYDTFCGGIFELPLFWSLDDRRYFLYSLCTYIKSNKRSQDLLWTSSELENAFGSNCDWYPKALGNQTVKEFVNQDQLDRQERSLAMPRQGYRNWKVCLFSPVAQFKEDPSSCIGRSVILASCSSMLFCLQAMNALLSTIFIDLCYVSSGRTTTTGARHAGQKAQLNKKLWDKFNCSKAGMDNDRNDANMTEVAVIGAATSVIAAGVAVLDILRYRNRTRIPNIPRAPHVNRDQVEEDGIVKAFLALQPQGESLSDLTDRRRSSNKFYDIRISPFYQKILIDLIVVVRYSMSTDLQCDLSLSDVFILEDSDESCPPHITIMKFKFRDGHASNTDWSHLETFIQKINSRVNFPTRKEMGALLRSLKDLNEKNFATIASLSLFWSSSERVVFCGNWGDFSDTQLVPIHSNLAKPFGNNPSEWDKMVCRDPSLAIMKMQADKKMQVDKKEILTPGLAVDAMRCFKFIRKCLLHFDQMRTNGVVYNTPLEVLRAFEREGRAKQIVFKIRLVLRRMATDSVERRTW